MLLHLLAAALDRRKSQGSLKQTSIVPSETPATSSNGVAGMAFDTQSESLGRLRSVIYQAPPVIQAVYVTSPAPFDEVEAFVDDAIARYSLDLIKVSGPMKEALAAYLDLYAERRKERGTTSPGDIEAIFVGTRRNDPHGGERSISLSFLAVACNAHLCNRQITIRHSYRPRMASISPRASNY